jgi:hypothetical protein
MIGKFSDSVLQHGRGSAHGGEKIYLVIDIECFQRHGSGHRMPGIGKAMTQHAYPGALFGNRSKNPFVDHEGGNRDIA